MGPDVAGETGGEGRDRDGSERVGEQEQLGPLASVTARASGTQANSGVTPI